MLTMPKTHVMATITLASSLLAPASSTLVRAQEVPVVLTHTVEKGRLERVVRQTATLHPFEEVEVYAKVSGYAKEVRADIGDRVEAGHVLVALDLPELDAELRAAEAAVRTAGAALKRATASVNLKKAIHELTESLFEKEGRTRFQLDEARADLELASAELELARARQEEARAVLEKVTALREFGHVRAPFAGVVTQRLVDTGDLVRGGAAGAATPLFVVQRTDRLRCRVEVPERDAVLVVQALQRETLSASVVLDALPGEARELTTEEIAAGAARLARTVHPESHHMLAELYLANDDEKLLPGLFGKATLRVRRTAEAEVAIAPATAVQAPRNARPFVFVIKEEGGKATLEERPVELGLSDGTRVEILAGLSPGERIVVRGAGSLVAGQEVSARPQAVREGTP
jgi:RND family efflux transporter MFP subunit